VPDYPTIPESLPTTRTQTVHAREFRGAGIRIAVLEGGTPNVAASNFRLIATQDTGVCCILRDRTCVGSGGRSGHMARASSLNAAARRSGGETWAASS
jgi:hypothetical protein